ncbi:MAG TPA: extracellular solute-binding protein [Gaiellaceae bacterium]|nr:extracellular solute-binding protein [Gaiellaceae bacterium]
MEGLLMQNLKRMWALLGVAAAVGAVAASSAVAAHKAGPTIVIWTDANRAPAVTKVANSWATSNGATVKVVSKDFGSIQTSLGTVAAADAPDIVLAAHDWTGGFAANGLVVPLYPSRTVLAQFPKYTLNAFSYGTAVKKLYGLPVQVENIGLIVNTKLAPAPKTFAQLEATALKFKKRNHLAFGLCVQQGSGGDAYHMYPFFSGLGGYVFGTNRAGNLDPSDIGVANSAFIKNAKTIDKWNKEGLINSKADYATCDTAFTKSKTPYWITGPWAMGDITKAGIKVKVVQVPKIVKPSVPFLGVNGLMVTKFASTHGVDSAAKDLVTNFFSTPSAQTQLAAAGGRAPANSKAKATDPILAQFGAAGKGGVPMPNIPQMSSVWSDLGAAWVRSTKGSGAMPAARSFRGAARSIAAKIG